MNRDEMVGRIEATSRADIVIVGGGATGLGCAIDAATRGYETVLLEGGDFAQGTSSRSTKLIHGGIRYLRQGNFALVLEALKERGLLRRNAPHLVHNRPFVVPNYDWRGAPFYGFGLKLYDVMAGQMGFGKSQLLSRDQTIARIPTIEPEGLRGGAIYHDGQFDDARLAIGLARTAADQGAAVANYMPVVDLMKDQDVVVGVVARDLEAQREYQVKAKVVINATGAFSDAVRRLDEPNAVPMICPSQGSHLVLDQTFLPGNSAIMIPRTSDGRVVFMIPWHARVLVGTTDTPVERVVENPKPRSEEVEYLLSHAAQYLTKDPAPSDVLSAFAGIRPLVAPGNGQSTASISREHTIYISHSGLLSIAGGKWTTYRKMAEDAVDQAAELAGLQMVVCSTHALAIHGHDPGADASHALAGYGTDATLVSALGRSQRLHDALDATESQVLWAVRHEMARTIEDVLARRTRCLLLNARASIAAAPRAAELVAAELGRDERWQDQQVAAYTQIAQDHVWD